LTVNIPSGQKELLLICTINWSPENARERMASLISSHGYTPLSKNLHAVACVNDIIAQGVTLALLDAGYVPGPDFPIVTGLDCTLESVRNIVAGTQSMTIYWDTSILARQAVIMANAIIKGEDVSVNDTSTYDNLSKLIPSFLCIPVVVDIANYKEILIDSVYYTMDEIYSNS